MGADFNRLLADEIPDAAIVVTPRGEILHWNKGAESLLGYTAMESIGCLIHELTVPSDRIAEEFNLLQQTVKSGAATFEGLRQRKDGSLIYADISSKVVHLNNDDAPLVLLSGMIRSCARL